MCTYALMLLLLLYASLPVGAVEESAIVNLKLTDGLAGETVHSVMTDHIGHVWIATTSGVSVYNGRRLVAMPIIDGRGRRVSVNDLCETSSHVIYAATEAGVYRLPMGSEHFEPVMPEVPSARTLLAVHDTVYVGSEQGLVWWDGRQLHHTDVGVGRSGLDNIVRQYVRGDDGKIWFLSRYDLNSFDPKTERVERHTLEGMLPEKAALSRFASLGDSLFAIGTKGHGLFLYERRASSARRVEGVGNIVSTVERNADGTVSVATDGSGAYLLEMQTSGGETRMEIRETFNTDADSRHRLPSNGVYCYHRDQHGVNWFGFVRYGLAYTYYNSGLFDVFSVGDFTTDGINVRSYCRHGDHVVIGTQSGFHYANAATGQHRYFTAEELGGGHIVTSVCWWEGCFYVDTFDGGLRVLDPATMTLRHQPFTPILDNGLIGDIEAGPDGCLWIGSSHGLIIIADGEVYQHFTEQNSRIVGGLILSITFDRSGNAWLTGANGCSLYSMRSREIVETLFPEGFFNKEPWMRGAAGHDGLTFMRTGPQTFYTNEGMTDFGELHLPVAFTDKWCRSFADDMAGHYWVASERGVFRFDYDGSGMLRFAEAEGLRGDFINDMSYDEPTATLWVATSQGLYSLDTRRLDSWQQADQARIQLFHIRCGSDLLTAAEEYLANESRKIRLT